MKQVSVIIPTFNRAEKLLRAVSSVFDQTYSDFELIVVDDGSRDNTYEVLAPFKGKLNVIRHLKNMGVSAARNSGIKASKSHLVAFLDSFHDVLLNKSCAPVLEYFRCQRNNLHKFLGTQFTSDRTEDTGTDRLQVVIQDNCCIAVETDG